MAIAVMACLALAGCGSRDETTTPKSNATIRIVVPPGTSSAALIANTNRQKLFGNGGLQVTQQTATTGLDAVATGRAELAVASEPAVLQARNRGLMVQSVASLVHGPRVAVISTTQIQSASDLAGKRLGYFGGPYAQAFAKTLSARAGGQGIHVAPVSDPTKALQKHQVDAVIGPAGAVHVKKAKAVTVDRLGIPTYDEEVLVAKEGTSGTSGDDVRSFIGALWHQAQGKAPGAQSPAQWSRFAEWMEANGLQKGQPSTAAVVTNDLLPGLRT